LSRSQTLGVVLAIVLGAVANSSAAQDLDDTRVKAMIAHAHDVYSVPPAAPTGSCGDGGDGAITVCGHDDGADQRIPSTADSDPDSPEARHALADGMPRTPWVSDLPDCRVEQCMRFGRAPPPIYIIDLSKIPLPPPGSDAEKIAKGEMRAP
jgi:hypothetical protein